MDKKKLVEIINDVGNKSNKDVREALDFLFSEFEETKKLILDLTDHLNTVEKYYYTVSDEMKKRIKK